MLQIHQSQSFSPDSPVQHLSTLIYTQYQMPTVCDLLAYPLQPQDQTLLIRDSNPSSIPNSYSIVVKICEYATRGQQICVEKLIGLSDRVVCIGLEQELESKIEKYYVGVMPELYVRYAGLGNFVKRPSLCFVNETYRKVYSRDAEGIYYYRTVEEYMATLPQVRDLRQSMITLAETRSYKIIAEATEIDPNDLPAITISQLLSLYSNTSLSQKDAAQIKYSMLSYKQLLYTKKKKRKAEQYIFRQGLKDINRSVLRQIGKQNLPKKYMAKLEWKYERVKNFGELLYEEEMNRELVRKYRKCGLFDLQQDAIILEVKQFYRVWIRNTLATLQLYFKQIVNRRDTKAVSLFRQKCSQTLSILNNSILHCQTDTKNYTLLLQMHTQIQQYINAHQNIIKDEYLSSIKYVLYACKYKWRNQPKIFHKGGFFGLVLLLALMQGNVIIGLALVSVGCIFLAINI